MIVPGSKQDDPGVFLQKVCKKSGVQKNKGLSLFMLQMAETTEISEMHKKILSYFAERTF